MTPLLLFLLACAAVYVGTVTAAFSTIMRLSLRLEAERSDRRDLLGVYLDDPLQLFIPARLLLSLFSVSVAVLLARVTGIDLGRGLPLTVVSTLVFILLCEHLLPLILVRRAPERMLDMLLPPFQAVARVLSPATAGLRRVGAARRERPVPSVDDEAPQLPAEGTGRTDDVPEPQQEERQARELLRSLVDFRQTMVREVMTPRPDIVAVSATASLGELLALFREQQYSRVPVYTASLDNILGFIFVKDVIQLTTTEPAATVTSLVRPAYFVPETKRVPELLREFQRNRVQSAIVVDEYGGTAGLVTIEDLLEEIVGEIRDEYDTELEPIVEEQGGSYVFTGKAHVEDLAQRLNVTVEGEGFETVGGYLLAHLGRVPAVGETFDIDGLVVEVLEAERRRINRVRIRRREMVAESAGEPMR
ncbi:MAG: hemolysin family protein [Vicinamibacterales bacterium]